MFDGRWRHGVDRVTGPVGRQLVRWRVTADLITASGLVFAVATAIVVATGHLLVGIPLLAITGCHDLFDGPVAKAAGTASTRGALFDSVSDRVADAVLMGGVAWYLVSVHDGEVALLPLAVLGAASLVSYVRAKAEALGLATPNSGIFGGLMERAERMILLGVGFLEPWLLVPVLWVLLSLTMLTAGARFLSAWRAADGPQRAVRPARPSVPARPMRRTSDAGAARPRWWRTDAGTEVQSVPARGELTTRWRARRQEALETRAARVSARRARVEAARAAHSRHGGRRDRGVDRVDRGVDRADRGVDRADRGD